MEKQQATSKAQKWLLLNLALQGGYAVLLEKQTGQCHVYRIKC